MAPRVSSRNLPVTRLCVPTSTVPEKSGGSDSTPVLTVATVAIGGKCHLLPPLVQCERDGGNGGSSTISAATATVRARGHPRWPGWSVPTPESPGRLPDISGTVEVWAPPDGEVPGAPTTEVWRHVTCFWRHLAAGRRRSLRGSWRVRSLGPAAAEGARLVLVHLGQEHAEIPADGRSVHAELPRDPRLGSGAHPEDGNELEHPAPAIGGHGLPLGKEAPAGGVPKAGLGVGLGDPGGHGVTTSE